MSEEALRIVKQLDDLEAVRFLTFLGEQLYEGMEEGELAGHSPGNIPGIAELERLSFEERQASLDPEISVQLAREILEYFANDEGLAPALEQAWKNHAKDEMFVGIILAAGFATSMILFAATSELEGEIFGIKFRKHVASAEMVEGLAKAVFGAIKPAG